MLFKVSPDLFNTIFKIFLDSFETIPSSKEILRLSYIFIKLVRFAETLSRLLQPYLRPKSYLDIKSIGKRCNEVRVSFQESQIVYWVRRDESQRILNKSEIVFEVLVGHEIVWPDCNQTWMSLTRFWMNFGVNIVLGRILEVF